MLLLPGDPLDPRSVDPRFAAEASAARTLGVPVAVVDHSAREHWEDVVAAVPAADDAVYRGWAMTPAEYTAFAKVLDARRVTLRTSPDDFSIAQDRSRWSDALRAVVLEQSSGPVVRTWWIGGRCTLTTPHPDTPGQLPDTPDLVEIEPLVTDLALPFVTVDLVRRTDGAWRIAGLTDGQISDWPTSHHPADLLAALF
ncbi:ATP-grasp domain-containing protein [Streptomyces sp. SID13031]|uniref:ATP-grasp domain-containing protein n=1 Tax=Streptomyces sp. SID13031 TaxID=2706046 RepID=UPI0013CAAD74|nr:ATP-grasp domain-containing protein [Streptomyces sp. SID13031]NEA34682.1 ATP-grasp domain-containing protein [Streptomyces sp. SID13031]